MTHIVRVEVYDDTHCHGGGGGMSQIVKAEDV